MVDDQLDKSWMGTAANYQAVRMHWLERELSELRGRVQQQEQGASLGSVPMKTGPQSRPGEPLCTEQGETRSPKSPPPTSKVGTEEGVDGGVKDDLRSVSVVLPRLPEEGAHQAALKCGDWIAEITSLINDVGAKASKWWSTLMKEVGEAYKLWLSSTTNYFDT